MNPSEEADEFWFEAQGEMEDSPMLMRGRRDLDDLASPESHPIRLVVTWFCSDPQVDGMPSEMDRDEVAEFNAELLTCLEAEGDAFLAFVFTYDGTVEFNFYARDLEVTVAKLEEAFGVEPELPIQLAAEEEGDWADYRDIQAQVKSTQESEPSE